MRFLSSLINSTSDILAIGIGAVIISSFSYLFYADITKKVDIGDAELVGSITFKKLVAQRKYSSQVVWEDVQQNSPVYNNDSIRTAEQSEAIIKLNDGTKINVNENSMILLALAKDQINIEFSYGSLLANRDNIMGKVSKKLNIKSEKATVSMDKGNIKLDQGKNKTLNLTVRKGNAAIATAAGAKTIEMDQKVVLAQDSDKIELFDLNLKLNKPAPNRYLFTTRDEMDATFTWEKVLGDFNVYLEISVDRAFSDLEFEKRVKGDSRTVELDTGTYYWRLKAINKITRKTEYSDSRRLNIIHDDPIQLISPEHKTQFYYRNITPIISFKWSTSEIASVYKMMLAWDPTFKNIVRTTTVPSNRFALDNLKKGTYYWKIEKVLAFKDVKYKSASKTYRFVITQKEIIEPPSLIYPGKGKRISKKQLEKQSVTFTWKKNPQIKLTKFFISSDKKFEKIIFESESNVNFVKFDEELDIGKYYWRVIGELDDGDLTAYSITRSFNVIKTKNIKLILPVKNGIIAPGIGEKTVSVRFSWKKPDISGNYKLQLSRDDEFSEITKEQTLDSNSKLISDIVPGQYYWRVFLLDTDQSVLLNSKPQSFIVKKPLIKPKIRSPRNGFVVNMSHRNELSLDWEKVDGANIYHVSLYRMRRKRAYPVADIKIKKTKVRITDLRKLDIGRFRWTVQAMEADDSNEIIRKSVLVKNDFQIILGKKMEKINIDNIKIDNL